MEIKVAKTAGFCFGVNRAVELTYGLLAEGRRVATLGPLIHNPQAVADMQRRGALVADTVEAKGAFVADSVPQVPDGYEVVIRSHGVPRSVYDELGARGIAYHDATCPFVQKIQRIAAEGHQVGNHSYDHAQLESLTCAQAVADLQKNDDLLQELLGAGEYWVRPPYGLCSDREAESLTVPLVNWSVDTEDWKSKDADKIVDIIYRQAADGDIILLHDRYQNTVDAVLRAVPHLQEQGYVFVTVSELLALKGVTPEPGVTYHRAP